MWPSFPISGELAKAPPRRRDDAGPKDQGGFSYHLRDTGCYLHPRCLECPRPQCILDEKKYKKHAL